MSVLSACVRWSCLQHRKQWTLNTIYLIYLALVLAHNCVPICGKHWQIIYWSSQAQPDFMLPQNSNWKINLPKDLDGIPLYKPLRHSTQTFDLLVSCSLRIIGHKINSTGIDSIISTFFFYFFRVCYGMGTALLMCVRYGESYVKIFWLENALLTSNICGKPNSIRFKPKKSKGNSSLRLKIAIIDILAIRIEINKGKSARFRNVGLWIIVKTKKKGFNHLQYIFLPQSLT